MPRNESGIYSLPAGSTAISGTTISSAPYNAALADLAADLNAVRPISSGGTGASTAAAALAALGGIGGPTLTSIAALGTAADRMLYSTALNAWAETPITAAGRALLDDADAAAQRATMGLGAVTGFAEAVADLDTITRSGWARFSPGAANAPIADNSGYVLTITSGSVGVQMAWGHLGSADNTFSWMRWRGSSGWRPWVRLYGSQSEIRAFAFGEGQTWQNVSAARAHSTAYQNTSGKPIMVSVRLQVANGMDFQVSADGTSWITVAVSGTGEAMVVPIVVPNGHYYKVLGGYRAGTWVELR